MQHPNDKTAALILCCQSYQPLNAINTLTLNTDAQAFFVSARDHEKKSQRYIN